MEEEEDFMKICELVPDIHYASLILKVFEIEAVIVQSSSQQGKNRSNNIKQLWDLNNKREQYGSSPGKNHAAAGKASFKGVGQRPNGMQATPKDAHAQM